jgi:hypothetical protein
MFHRVRPRLYLVVDGFVVRVLRCACGAVTLLPLNERQCVCRACDAELVPLETFEEVWAAIS